MFNKTMSTIKKGFDKNGFNKKGKPYFGYDREGFDKKPHEKIKFNNKNLEAFENKKNELRNRIEKSYKSNHRIRRKSLIDIIITFLFFVAFIPFLPKIISIFSMLLFQVDLYNFAEYASLESLFFVSQLFGTIKFSLDIKAFADYDMYPVPSKRTLKIDDDELAAALSIFHEFPNDELLDYRLNKVVKDSDDKKLHQLLNEGDAKTKDNLIIIKRKVREIANKEIEKLNEEKRILSQKINSIQKEHNLIMNVHEIKND